MHYTLHQLQVFLRVAQSGSITKAAEQLHLTQPAVSIQLRNFQDQFDIPLIETVGRKLYVTDFGKEVAAAAERIVTEIETINHKTKAYKGHIAGKLRISVVSTGNYVMPYFLNDFLKLNQEVDLIMDVTNKSKVLDSLAANEVDFALVSVLPKQIPVDNVELMMNKLYLIGNKDFKLKRGGFTKDIFKSLPLIYRENGSGTRFVMQNFMEKNKITVQKKMELTSNEAVKQAVIAGLGCSIMPLIGIKNELNSGDLKIIPVKGFPIKSIWQLIWLRKKKHTPAAQAYLNYIREEKNQIIKTNFEWINQY